ncbi:hypothetical protein G7046_g8887 [Stylonectria norvegica]|nr:hypothetical protein G7046_g8887 [Stylonectria norvegica]
MPAPNDPEAASNESDSLLEHGKSKVKRFLEDFIDFAFSGNILQIAFGFILASGFTALVKSFVSDILMPPLSVILPLNKNIEEKFAVLKAGPEYKKIGYNTLQQAQDDGAVVMPYGSFVSQVISFIMLGFALYGLAHFYQFVSNDPIIKHTVKCAYCRVRINKKAKRCVNCTSWLDGREDGAGS